jgi:hypothetical protein
MSGPPALLRPRVDSDCLLSDGPALSSRAHGSCAKRMRNPCRDRSRALAIMQQREISRYKPVTLLTLSRFASVPVSPD